MRAWNKQSSDENREHYLGQIAPLLEAARQVESLSPAQTGQVRRRIARTLFGTRHLTFRARWVPVLVALALLVIGGAAFATAQRLGLLPSLGHKEASAPAGQATSEARKRKATRGRPGSQFANPASDGVGPTSGQATVVLPEIPDPLLYPFSPASTAVWAPLAENGNPLSPGSTAGSRVATAPAAIATTSTRRPLGQVAFASPTSAPVFPAPTLGTSFPGPLAPGPAEAPPAIPAFEPSPPAPAPALPQAAPAAPPPETQASAQKSPLGDQALFGQAIRKLRSEHSPSAALVALQQHRAAFPSSALDGERTALEVEALLALHRDPEALALLDTMAVGELPRSGERFVVRGELRAAAHRWQEASADFDRALARVSGSPTWHERALWGRGVARLHLGEREAGMVDIKHYRDSYPRGRFAAEADKLFPQK